MIGKHDNADQTTNYNDNTNRRHNQQQVKLQTQTRVKKFTELCKVK